MEEVKPLMCQQVVKMNNRIYLQIHGEWFQFGGEYIYPQDEFKSVSLVPVREFIGKRLSDWYLRTNRNDRPVLQALKDVLRKEIYNR